MDNQQPNLYEIIGQMTVQQKVLVEQFHTVKKENEDLKHQLEETLKENEKTKEA
ncbi:MAG: hypothetical protein ACQEWF_01660 [Bacillota bacterium]